MQAGSTVDTVTDGIAPVQAGSRAKLGKSDDGVTGVNGQEAGGSEVVVGSDVSVFLSGSSVFGGSWDEVGYEGGVVGAGGAPGLKTQAASAPPATIPAPIATATATVSEAPSLFVVI